MKLINLIQIKNIFKPDMEFKDIQVGYKVMKFLKSIENDTNFYDRADTEGNLYGTAQYKLSGGGQPHNNMPPYLAVYVWKRTA